LGILDITERKLSKFTYEKNRLFWRKKAVSILPFKSAETRKRKQNL
jgi:hypothetical protein